MSLSAKAIEAARPRQKPYKLSDRDGLYLLVSPAGGRLWRFKFRRDGRERLLALGSFPEVSLDQARQAVTKAREDLRRGVDPAAKKQAEKIARGDTFKAIALEWIAQRRHDDGGGAKKAKAKVRRRIWSQSHAARVERGLEADVFPYIGKMPIADIDAPTLLRVVRRIESRGAIDSAHRALQNCGAVFRFAVATGRATRDVSHDLRGALTPVVVEHRAAIKDPRRFGELLRALSGYRGTFPVKVALQLAPYLFVRPGELRHAEWHEFDLDTAEWRIPAGKMKMRTHHIVPLSRQALELLQELNALTGPNGYLFPSVRTAIRPMSENTLNAALRRLGFESNEMTSHGFRGVASTLLNEAGHDPEVIELQLAHQDRNDVRAAYNSAQRLKERRELMQAWADQVDALRAAKPASA